MGTDDSSATPAGFVQQVAPLLGENARSAPLFHTGASWKILMPGGAAANHPLTTIIGIRRPLRFFPVMIGWVSHAALLVINYPAESTKSRSRVFCPSDSGQTGRRRLLGRGLHARCFAGLDVHVVELMGNGKTYASKTKIANCVQDSENSYVLDGVRWAAQSHIFMQFGKAISAQTVSNLMQRCFDDGGPYRLGLFDAKESHTCHNAQACAFRFLQFIAICSWQSAKNHRYLSY